MPLVPENLETANESAQWEIAGQIANASTLDAKAIGLLAFMAAAGGVLLTVQNGLGSNRWLLFVGAAGSAVVVLFSMLGDQGDDLESGPSAAKFYEDHGGETRDEFNAQLLADFGETIQMNKEKINARRNVLSGSVAWAVVWAVVFGLVRAF
jgi:hypothetical protein